MPSLKLITKHLLGRDLWIRHREHPGISVLGTNYGGWGLDLTRLDAKSVVYSFGIGEDASFDLELIRRLGCTVHGFDPTPKSLDWVRNHISEEGFQMYPWALGNEDGELVLWYPENPANVSATCAPPPGRHRSSFKARSFSVRSIMRQLGHESIDVLKMDIEGGEYRVLDSWREDGTLDRIDQLLIEFHHWISPFRPRDTQRALRGLAEGGFRVSWVSRSGHEVLFVRQKS